MTHSAPWWQTGVIYQIYPRSYQDSNSDGIGDLPGIISRLDYLNDGTPNSLGVDAIWLSPFYPSPMADFGYDVADYTNVDPMFGTLDDFDRLLAEVHRRGMKLIIDWVPNHSSDQHPWFIESRSSRDNPKRDWYIWRDAKPDGTPPNNWGSWFGGSAWEWDELTGQYYLHSFVKEQPDLNWANPEVYEAMLSTLRFWLDRGVDGFRMDVVFLIVKDSQFRDNPPNPDVSPDLAENDITGRQLNIYNREQPGIREMNRKLRQLLDEYDAIGVGEIFVDTLGSWIQFYGENQNDEFQIPFNFRLLRLPRWNADDFRRSVDELEALVPDFAYPNYVLGSHDAKRFATRYGVRNARTAGMLLLTLRGTPTFYQGDEIGMEEGIIPPDKIVDPQGINLGAERTRDGCRTPMQWDASAYAGFSTVEPWLPVADDYQTRNVSVQRDDPTSTLNFYLTLFHLRKASPALHIGKYTPLDSVEGTYVYRREQDGEVKLIALNFTDEPKTVLLNQGGELVLSTQMDRAGEKVSGTLELRPNEGVILAVQ